jgi:hypothetical protein
MRLLEPPATLTGKQRLEYAGLADALLESAKPVDVIETILVLDVVRHTWDLLTYRRQRDQLYLTSSHLGARAVLEGPEDPELARKFAGEYRKRTPEVMKYVDVVLAQAGLTYDAILVETLARRFSDFERLDRLIADSERRRNSALREVERHREALAAHLRVSAAEIEAEFTVLPAPPEPRRAVPLGEDERLKRYVGP